MTSTGCSNNKDCKSTSLIKSKAKLVDLGYNPAMGARPLRRVIQEQIEDKIADYYLDHETAATLTADVDSKGNIVIKNEAKAKAKPSTDTKPDKKDSDK